MFLKMKANCPSAGLTYFLGDKVTPTFPVLHTDYHYPVGFREPDLRYIRSVIITIFL